MRSARPTAGSAGFTLLELLIALAVFAVASVMAYGGLRTVLQTERDVTAHAERLAEVQKAFAILGRDLEQVVQRGVRDEFGDNRPAFMGDNADGGQLVFTRGGHHNPAGLRRSKLQRVGYRFANGIVERVAWASLDRVPGDEPYRMPLLGKVWRFEVRFYAGGNQWQTEWPPAGVGQNAGRPAAVEVTVELEDWGVIRRLYRLP